ncbi:MAG: ZPR1 zinc finger domain-containing protein [Methanohalobium sp.]|uniref:ZPR1 zinc finger domain-containing protein n=1 Tax=Methanohalobium sp. TaxID=2837493 RepID=UPI00397BC029
MTQENLSQDSFDTETYCPLCNDKLAIHWQSDHIPYFDEILYMSARCRCGFKFADTMITSQRDPVHYELTIENAEDLYAKVVRSTSGTIRIPEFGIAVEPGPASESYITNAEGLLNRVKSVIQTAAEWSKEDEDKYNHCLEIEKALDDTIEGNQKLMIEIDDPLGNSTIISSKAKSRKLNDEEVGNLKTGMVIYDVNSSDIKINDSEY